MNANTSYVKHAKGQDKYYSISNVPTEFATGFTIRKTCFKILYPITFSVLNAWPPSLDFITTKA
jgi:hypothetical protein